MEISDHRMREKTRLAKGVFFRLGVLPQLAFGEASVSVQSTKVSCLELQ